MADLAELGMRFKTEGAEAAEKHLDAITEKSERAEKATDSLSGGFGKAGTATGEMADQMVDAIAVQQEAVRHMGNLGSAAGRMAGDVATGNASLGSMSTNGAAAGRALLGLGGTIGAVAAAVAGLAVAAAAVGYLWLDGEKSALGYERAVTGVGRTAGLTADQLQVLTHAAADHAGMSIKASQEMAAAYLNTGQVGGEALGQLLSITKDFASFTGQDLPAAQRQLASAMEDPAKAAVEMTRQFGLLTQAQIAQIEAAVEAGDALAAQKIMMDAISDAADGHADKVGVMTNAWDAIGQSISNAITRFGEWLYVTDAEKAQMGVKRIEDGIAVRDARIAGLQTSRTGYGGATPASRAAEIRRLEAENEMDRQRLGGIRAADADRLAAERRQREAAAANQRAQRDADRASRTSTRSPSSRSTAAAGPTDDERAYADLIKGSGRMLDALTAEQAALGLTTAEQNRLATAAQARRLITEGETIEAVNLARALLDQQDALDAATAAYERSEAIKAGTGSLEAMVTTMRRQAAVIGQSAEAQAVMNAEWAIADLALKEITPEMQVLIDQYKQLAASNAFAASHNPLRDMADELGRIADLARDAGRGMAEAFGAPGDALGSLLERTAEYRSRLAEIAASSLDGAAKEQERAHAQIQHYGDMAGAAKGFFREGSDGYRILQAAEQGYRLFQFAMSIQAMALGATETAASVSQSATRGAASMAAGAAKMFEFLGPLGFPAVAAMLALLAVLGLKGGSKGSSRAPSASNDNVDASVEAARNQTQADERARDNAAQAVAQRVEVRVTADRDGLNAYVVRTAQQEATNVAAPMAAASAGYAKQDTLKSLKEQQLGNRKIAS